MTSMNLLNEISIRYPEAVSFAAGRPAEQYFELAAVHRHLDRYVEHLRTERGLTEEAARRLVLQYGRTKGIIHDLIAAHLAVDEGIAVPAESIVVTVGCQEAMFLVLRALRCGPEDVVLAVSPTYVGLTGAALLADLPVLAVADGPDGVDLADLRRRLAAARAEGLRPRALYLVPDVANPSGASLPLELRRELLELAAEEDFLLLEDNPYGVFAGDERLPSLKALDTGRRVVHLGSFAKTALPGARVGYVVADQLVADGRGGTALFADLLGMVKSMTTVNTSPIAQAVIGGALLEHGHSLRAANTGAAALYRRNLALVLEGLARRFPPGGGVTWNEPRGGFFLVLTVPCVVDDALLERSASEYGVIWTPMSHFYPGAGGEHRLRLSVSQVDPATLDRGLDGLAALLAAEGLRGSDNAVLGRGGPGLTRGQLPG
ncbi:aminotransferase class I/II-fold pyridoxal phosphate-dependent enzyme [Kitasatospora sp. NPDC091335]|uniref:aminotransferase class I/II-fold pyridoxal phosphate-dependent enzyme n=1 Tax=Kitasatospora sp. NPDC091335 TaxID=3364085 RepID=UPI00382AAF9A